MPYAFSVKTNSMRLYEEAVKVAIKGARSASVIISNLSKEKGLSQYEAKTTKVCIKSVKNSVHQFKKSVKAIGDMIGEQDEYELFYARSYAYSALTNLGSCIDGFADQPERQINSNGKKVIDRSMSVISKLGNAALSLISHPYIIYYQRFDALYAYPSLCVKTLMPYASSVKTNSTRLCKKAVKKGYEAVATKDFIRATKTVVYQLKETIKVLGDKESQLHEAISYTLLHQQTQKNASMASPTIRIKT
ncbi:hypothetical protein H5410_016461 [Solanum commersonii]|uniref:Pectinesterase inhibitor domain-containing protein n=1 Tax=Solanum commersonii TaxID=4109 RepID=A0A9J5ZWB0_SOLCO|nr:hypothetical protein H5410_016461 [Solanum commersonii]